LALPLALQGEVLGVWLIGRRDPDDYFPRSDIHLLSTVANQIAAVLENIHLYEQAQQEIAQRRIAEQEIRRSEERFRNLFEATLEGIALVKGGAILEVNHALLAIFGYASAAELIGRRLSDLISEDEPALTEEPREGFGFRNDGSRVDVEAAGKKYVFQGEDVTVVAIRDITRRKRDEAENRMLQGQLLHSQKMEAIGRLSAGVAHDFNNCLLAIFGYSDLLLGSYRDEDFLARNLSGIKEAAQKAAALTRQLLTFARRQPLETRVMDLNQVVSGIDKMLRRLIGEDIELATDLYPELEQVKIDPGQMEQVLLNLAVNARHAMPDGGRLMIRTTPVHVTARGGALHADVPPGSYVVLTVADTGVGMDAATQARIFEPFFTTKEVGEGTGLGLSTAYGIVRQSNGHIFVDSAPGQGARFTIYLPATAEETIAVAPLPAGWSDTGSETILLVEDEPEARSMLFQTLLRKGYRVLQAASGDEALALAHRYPETIHLLLTDVIMPRMKGPDLAARLLTTHPRTRVLFMSGYNEESLPSNDSRTICLQKPFAPQLLTQMVRAILDADDMARAV
jgi:PAS domain S-box-containing protein